MKKIHALAGYAFLVIGTLFSLVTSPPCKSSDSISHEWICSVPSQPASANIKFLAEVNSQLAPIIQLKILSASSTPFHYKASNCNFMIRAGAVAQGQEIEAIQNGKIDAGLLSPQDLIRYLPQDKYLQSLVTPGTVQNFEDAKARWTEGRHVTEEQLLKKAAIRIVGGPLCHGNRHLYLTRDCGVEMSRNTFKNMSLKFRVPDSKSWANVAEYYGAEDILEVKNPKLKNALENSQIDAFEMPVSSLLSNQLEGYVKQMVIPHHLTGMLFWGMSEAKFNLLSLEQQESIEAAIENSIEQHNSSLLKREMEDIKYLKARGVIVKKWFDSV